MVALVIGLLADCGEDGAVFQQFKRCRYLVKSDNAWVQPRLRDSLTAAIDAACCKKECIGIRVCSE